MTIRKKWVQSYMTYEKKHPGMKIERGLYWTLKRHLKPVSPGVWTIVRHLEFSERNVMI